MARTFLACLGLLLAGAACRHQASIPPIAEPSPSPVDKRTACEKKFSERIDQVVTVSGRFSLFGKLGTFVLVDGCQIYLLSDRPFDWNADNYSRMEGQEVRVTGTLRFKDYPELPPGPQPVGRAPDHFYFDARTSTIELNPTD